jgi:acetate kinase
VLASQDGIDPDESVLDAYVIVERSAMIAARATGEERAVLGRFDALVLTGGIGEHVREVRAAVCHQLGFAGVRVGPDRHATVPGEGSNRAADATVSPFAVPAREVVEIARHVRVRLGPAL